MFDKQLGSIAKLTHKTNNYGVFGGSGHLWDSVGLIPKDKICYHLTKLLIRIGTSRLSDSARFKIQCLLYWTMLSLSLEGKLLRLEARREIRVLPTNDLKIKSFPTFVIYLSSNR